ncbi:MAG: deoxyribodipyrimidine photo-lyase, partial [Rhodobacteraceae bacterium]|nr:deoxyribodipyrimidine photo-lyase [Paracoccaceae bacterium]
MAGPILWRVRRDLRLADNPALAAAVAGGGAVVPVFVLDPAAEALGAAAKWRLGQGLAAFDAGLRARGSRLILRRGEAGAVLAALAAETGAQGVVWNRLYDPASRTDDTALKARLRAAGLAATSHAGHLLHEPWTIATAQGGPYRVFTPFWRALRARDPGLPWPAPDRLPAPAAWPASDALEGWRLGAGVGPGAA